MSSAIDNLSESEAAKRIDQLIDALRRFEFEYYVLNKPSVSDREYDRRYDELLRLEGKFPALLRPDSPSRRVGSDLSSDLPEVTHSIPVLSLDKAYSPDEIRQWIARCSKQLQGAFHVIIEEKMDGSSLVLYYEEGVLARAVSRGNGEVGNDISANVRTIRSIPLRLNEPITAAIRGEVFMTISDFRRIREELGADYANPRNYASGSLRRIKSAEVARIPLRFFAYEPFGEGFDDSHHENLRRLGDLGLPVNPHQTRVSVDPRDPADVERAMKEIGDFLETSTARRPDLDYEIDGMVLKIDEVPARQQLGYTGHHPRWAVAYKFESPEGVTRVLGIDVQIGRTGRATPVARVEPVAVGGTTIQNVTLHNQDYIDALALAPGDTVAISRRGDVIPAVERVIEKGGGGEPVWTMPEACPTCGESLEKQGAHHFCVNFDCPDRKRGRIIFFTGRDQMDIDNLGSETVVALMEAGMVRDIPDLFRLDYAAIAELPGFAEKKADLIRRGIEKAKGNSYRRIMVSLGLNDFGPKLAELLEEGGYRNIDDLLALIDRGEEMKLTEIKGVGEKTVETVAAQLREPRLRRMVAELRERGLVFDAGEAPAKPEDGPFAGQRWCVTGSFETFKPRSKAMDEVKRLGGEVVSDVSSKTTHLLAGESAGSKLDKARKLGIQVVSEAEFLGLLDGER
jgi:DNA ligase (NAD+)